MAGDEGDGGGACGDNAACNVAESTRQLRAALVATKNIGLRIRPHAVGGRAGQGGSLHA